MLFWVHVFRFSLLKVNSYLVLSRSCSCVSRHVRACHCSRWHPFHFLLLSSKWQMSVVGRTACHIKGYGNVFSSLSVVNHLVFYCGYYIYHSFSPVTQFWLRSSVVGVIPALSTRWHCDSAEMTHVCVCVILRGLQCHYRVRLLRSLIDRHIRNRPPLKIKAPARSEITSTSASIKTTFCRAKRGPPLTSAGIFSSHVNLGWSCWCQRLQLHSLYNAQLIIRTSVCLAWQAAGTAGLVKSRRRGNSARAKLSVGPRPDLCEATRSSRRWAGSWLGDSNSSAIKACAVSHTVSVINALRRTDECRFRSAFSHSSERCRSSESDTLILTIIWVSLSSVQEAVVSKYEKKLGAPHTWTLPKFAFNKSDLVWFKMLRYAGSSLQGLRETQTSGLKFSADFAVSVCVCVSQQPNGPRRPIAAQNLVAEWPAANQSVAPSGLRAVSAWSGASAFAPLNQSLSRIRRQILYCQIIDFVPHAVLL